MKKVNMAVIGVGAFGRHHARHLSANPAIETLTIVDRDIERARAVAGPLGAEAAASVSDLALDAAVVTVPTEAHAAVAGPLLERGVHVFIEKPIADTGVAADALIRAADASGAVLQIGHIERFSAAFEALAKNAGPVRHIAARRHNPPRPVAPTVDVVLDLMIHDIDLCLTLAGAPVTSVEAFAPDGTGHEAAIARLVFANGAVADISASRLAPVVERTLDVHDNAGVLHADLVAKAVVRTTGSDVTPIELGPERDSLATELAEFLNAIATGSRPRVDGAAASAALAVAIRIRDALSRQRLSLSA
ncbi:Gfo/Idh/MocA family oxidoreductase [Acuticoccus sp. MNP-M23]|uniref:Gfo/Idh/MocA family protein n=1 Tax=Acuticoccus sp. MNP-M23 TaxID=3072793 RepID=UPI0028164478|nr:Gfo/Idh/MocA family oxidoreductase [Acuticoccus sp. MNP-M23]WMS43416.1 Gfo/Idh/MocA family oxidoreductase [Acuticoccus sp. MNP-M23]